MRGRIWLILGAVAGLAVALGHLPYLAGAARSFADTTERLVASGAHRLIRDAASAGAPRRAVLAASGVAGALLPGLTALLLVIAARGSLRVRALVALVVLVIGASSYAYQPHGRATGVLALALLVALLAVALTGPLVAAPLAATATLIGAEFLPGLLTSERAATQPAVVDLHTAIFNHPGTPKALQIAVLVLAALPFAWAARLILAG